MYRADLRKPDGRRLILYSRLPPVGDLLAPSPEKQSLLPEPHLRWHPLRGEWVAYSVFRRNITFVPPPGFDPLRPAEDPGQPSELPAGNYDIAVFEDRMPVFVDRAPHPPAAIVPTAAAGGECEVVVYTQDANTSLGSLPLDHIALLIDVLADRTTELGARDEVGYVFAFEDRGTEAGATLHHPHGRIYAYPFVPPLMLREAANQRVFWEKHGVGLLSRHTEAEIEDGRRMLFEGRKAVAYVPACARYPYEVWVVPLRPVAFLAFMSAEERVDLARALKIALLKLDGLWDRPMPLFMSFHQAPTDARPHPEAHVHIQIYPALRSESRLRYPSSGEIAAGTYTADFLPEDKAAELRAVRVESLGWS